MIGLFKQKSPVNVVLLLILALLIKMPLFLNPEPLVVTEEDGRLYKYLLLFLTNGLTAAFVAFALVYAQALMVNGLVNEQRNTSKPTYLPALSYLLITSLLPEWLYLSAPMVASTFIIWSFIKLFRTYDKSMAYGKIYDIGLIVGISSFIFFPSAAFTIPLLLGVLILRPFQLNEIILLLLGLLTPYYFYGIYLFLNDGFSYNALLPNIQLKVPVIKSTVVLTGTILAIVIPFVIGAYEVQNHLRRMVIQVRKNWAIFFFYMVIALLISFINTGSLFNNWIMALPPFAAYQASGYLYTKKNWVSLVLFFLTIGFILFQQYALPLWQH